MKRAGLILGVVFVVVLAVVVGNRMSVDAMAVVVGVACGVLASIPTSLLLIWALGRNAGAAAYGDRSARYPPIAVVNPGQSYGRPGYGSPPMYSAGDELSLPALATSRWWAMLRRYPTWPITPGGGLIERVFHSRQRSAVSGQPSAFSLQPLTGHWFWAGPGLCS